MAKTKMLMLILLPHPEIICPLPSSQEFLRVQANSLHDTRSPLTF